MTTVTSADKRTPHTDALDTLGKIHVYDEHRDAIHLGVEPVTAGEVLKPGDHILLHDGFAYLAHSHKDKTLGIVDPFLLEDVQPGQKFWLVVYPREITSLRHVWEHPDFPKSELKPIQEIDDKPMSQEQMWDVEEVIGSEVGRAWSHVKNLCNELSTVYLNDGTRVHIDDVPEYEKHEYVESAVYPSDLLNKMQEVGNNKSGYIDYWNNGPQFEGMSLSDEDWEAAEVLLKTKLENKENFFSCSC